MHGERGLSEMWSRTLICAAVVAVAGHAV